MSYTYFKFPENINERLAELKQKPSEYWLKRGEEKAISLANFSLQKTPAYQKFIKNNSLSIKKINSIEDFKKLPFIDKNNYLRKYPYKELFPEDYLSKTTTFSSTSGSTGEPFYFPRGEEQDAQYEYIAELFLKNQIEIDKKKTLAINGFGLGIWIGGIFTYKNFNKIAAKGHPLAIAPTGTSKEIFLKTFLKTADLFDQIILMGYPPFLRDIIDEGKDFGIDWSKYQIKILTATEGFTEKFRDYLVKKTGINNKYLDIINIYGSVELGTMAHETPLSVLIRNLAVTNKKLFATLFPNTNLQPTLAQYHPYLTFFEEVEGQVYASGFGSLFPLIRYQFHDKGGVITFQDMISKLNDLKIDIYEICRQEKIDHTILKLPFVYVYERSDFVVILRGANIYPENIKIALQNEDLEKLVTGKFTMIKKENVNLDEYLEINVELKKEVKKRGINKKLIEKIILNTLNEINSEFHYLYTTEGKKVAPRIALFNYEDPKYFAPNIKQSWTKKN